jgi:hypothetical protein
MKIEVFTKNFFPTKFRDEQGKKGNYDFSDSDNSDREIEPKSKSPFGRRDTQSINEYTMGDNSSVMSVSKNREINNKIKEIEDAL